MHGLNPQAAAVLHIEGPLLVLAGAGSGKTRDHLHQQVGQGNARSAWPTREQDADEVTICTFHALGLKFLQIEHAAVGLKRGFSIFDADDAAAQIKDLMHGAKPDDIEDMKNLVSRAKNAGLSPEQAMAAARATREVTICHASEVPSEHAAGLSAIFDAMTRRSRT